MGLPLTLRRIAPWLAVPYSSSSPSSSPSLGTALIVLYVQGIDARATEGQELVEVLAATDDHRDRRGRRRRPGGRQVREDRGPARGPRRRRAVLDQLDLRPRRHRHDLPRRAAHRQEVRQPGRHRDAWSSRTTRWPSRSSSPTSSGSPASSTRAPRWPIFVIAPTPSRCMPDGKEQKLPRVHPASSCPRCRSSASARRASRSRPRPDRGRRAGDRGGRPHHPDRRGRPGARPRSSSTPTATRDLTFALLTEDSKVADEPGVTAGDIMPEIFRAAP